MWAAISMFIGVRQLGAPKSVVCIPRQCVPYSARRLVGRFFFSFRRIRRAELPHAGIRSLAMDEFALHKGHRFATVVVDPIGQQVLWICQGRSRETARLLRATATRRGQADRSGCA
ncbi:protein of unknown function (plasmid) [Cupriavidus taiwanensis]|uniref:Transposase IS204/IS1001/IS1096/IS1165 DDE domain-containing protein n=1 Tax=Cupriavidus taiwanensis TaxID=164546 RepID=A0A375I850_9BURK|nr:hypothetical protein CT19425_U470007 [Cupriavidus taiwanensis]SPK77577.1 protein of unknown function [Cupriavidus taiwanensis]